MNYAVVFSSVLQEEMSSDHMNVVSSPSSPECVFCFQLLEKLNERNLIDGKAEFKVISEFDDLNFVVYKDASKYICKKCLNLFKKRFTLKKNLWELDNNLLEQYRKKCNQRGLTVKTRNPTKRSLLFTDVESHGYDSLPHFSIPVAFSSPAALVNSPARTPRASFEVQSQTSRALSSFSGDIKSSALPSNSSSSLGSPGFLKIQSPFSVSNSSDTTPQHEIQYSDSCQNPKHSGEMELKQNRQNMSSVTSKNASTQTQKLRDVIVQYDKSGKKVAPVLVRVGWESGDRYRHLPVNLCSLGKMLLRGTFKQIATAAWRCPDLKQHLVKEMLKTVHHECASLCTLKEPSSLWKTSKDGIQEFTFEKLQDELSVRAPVFNAVLKTASLKTPEEKQDLLWLPTVSMAAAICLKNRSSRLTVVQLLVSIILQHCGLTVRNIFVCSVFMVQFILI